MTTPPPVFFNQSINNQLTSLQACTYSLETANQTVVHNSIESGDMQLIGEAYYHRLFFFVLDRVAPAEKTHEKNGENGLAEWGDIQTTTTKAYHPDVDHETDHRPEHRKNV
ncbi:unnamed protein product [Tilletia caries]|nr:unnamed protein product [Tilletia caries]